MRKAFSIFLTIAFILPYGGLHAQTVTLPIPGTMLSLSRAYMPVSVKGLMLNPKEPFKFDFLIDSGDTGLKGDALKPESMKLIKYFLAALTVPDNEMWVNLSPYEKDRIIPKSFGDTEMGRDLLAQDYILKQLTASLTYPEKDMGKQFWNKVYSQAQAKFGTSNIPVNTFNKVWIVPSTAKIYEHNNGAFVVESKLKVMLEQDYLAMGKNKETPTDLPKAGQNVGASQVIREIIIPELEREINEGSRFANLRQIYQAMILATWYKIRLKDSILSKLYVNKDKTKGVGVIPAQAGIQNIEGIYQQYLAAFKKGVYNYIKEDRNAAGEMVPRKYVSGGFNSAMLGEVVAEGLNKGDPALVHPVGNMSVLSWQGNTQEGPDAAMLADSPLLRRLSVVGFLLWAGLSGANALTQKQVDALTQNFAKSIIELGEPNGIPPSHYNQVEPQRTTFTYDAGVYAMMLKAAGQQAAAENVLDRFKLALRIPLSDVMRNADMNGVYGLLKLYDNRPTLINAFDRTSTKVQGQAMLEYWTTPGPLSFVILAMLYVNKDKYLTEALLLGEALLAMQRPDGGIRDGDHFPARVYTEPHSDAMNVFYLLSQLRPGETKWKLAYAKASAWFIKNVLSPETGEIYQGIWEYGPNKIFATDAYSWSMAGKMGDLISLDVLERLTETMLSRSLVRITMTLSGGPKTFVLADFTDASDFNIRRSRGEQTRGIKQDREDIMYPMGSPEWTGGVILALQKNAVRFWKAGRKEKAREFKAMAEFLSDELLKAGYTVMGRSMFFYASAGDLATGHGWKTPVFRDASTGAVIGGSLIGGWGILPLNGINPFDPRDDYFKTYRTIDIGSKDRSDAQLRAGLIIQGSGRSIEEKTVLAGESPAGMQVAQAGPLTVALAQPEPAKVAGMTEPAQYNAKAWEAYKKNDWKNAKSWAQYVVGDPIWVSLAKQQQKKKAEAVPGGLVNYPWGNTYPNNDSPAQREIGKYALLNEVATAMWIMAVSNYELGNKMEAKKWLDAIKRDLAYHQIASVGPNGLINGYWNVLASDHRMVQEFLRGVAAPSLRQVGIKLPAPNYPASARDRTRAVYFIFNPVLDLPAGKKVRVRYTLKSTKPQIKVGVQMMSERESEANRGGLISLQMQRGANQELVVPISGSQTMQRFVIHYGDYAWGEALGGDFNADLVIHSIEIDNSMTAVDGPAAPGGIDLNSKNLDLQIKHGDMGSPTDLQDLEHINIEGLYPVILNIAPAANLPALLGLDHA